MRLPILLFFIFIPILEISVFMAIGGRIGSFNTIFIVLLTTVAGISLMRSQGLLILQKAQESIILNRFPVEVIFDGLCVFVAGMLLLIPGFVTDFIGFLVAWGYWISTWVSNAGLAIAIIGGLSFFFPLLNSNPIVSVFVGLSFVWLFTWINAKGIKESGRIQVITTILKLVPRISPLPFNAPALVPCFLSITYFMILDLICGFFDELSKKWFPIEASISWMDKHIMGCHK